MDNDKGVIPHSDKEFIEAYDQGQELSEYARWKFIYGEYGTQVDEITGEDHRWDKEKTTVCKICGRYFAIDWRAALTEYQESSCYNQPYEVIKREYEKTIKVTEWNKIKPSN